MLNRPAPNRRRRLFGGALTTLMAVVVAYTAWAAEPAAGSPTMPAASASSGGRAVVGWTAAWAGWLTAPNQAPDQPVIIVMHHAQLFLAAGAVTSIKADMVRSATMNDAQGLLQTITLEGHVHMTFTSPTEALASPRAIIVETSRAVLVGQPDGTSQVQFDDATMQTLIPPQFEYPGTPQILPQLLTPNSLTINLKDADISQAAAAAQLATHRAIRVDPRVRAQLNMLSTTPVAPEAFYQAFLDILHTRGFVAMPVGPAANAVTIRPGAND